MKTRILLSMLLLGLIYSCSTEAIETTTEADSVLVTDDSRASSTARPFKVRGSGDFAVEPSTECGALIQIGLQGGGLATHTGRFTVELTWCTDFAGTETIVGVVTAANGDEVNIALVGSGVDETGQPYGDYIFDGGTGRFSDATGEFRLFTSTVFTGEGVGTYSNYGTGTISY